MVTAAHHLYPPRITNPLLTLLGPYLCRIKVAAHFILLLPHHHRPVQDERPAAVSLPAVLFLRVELSHDPCTKAAT